METGWVTRWREHGPPALPAIRAEARRARRLTERSSADASSDRSPCSSSRRAAARRSVSGSSERWAPEHAATLEQSTRDRYANVYACHVAPRLDDVPLSEFTVARLRGWQAELGQGRRESRHDPQGPHVSLERAASRRRERGDPRQPAVTRAAAEGRAAGRGAAARARDRRDDPPRACWTRRRARSPPHRPVSGTAAGTSCRRPAPRRLANGTR